uniref:Uncharacterized protein n=1 Tax=Rhizophora mucronata TaxID=61149 RepID=A0A2P2N157_RHIMU
MPVRILFGFCISSVKYLLNFNLQLISMELELLFFMPMKKFDLIFTCSHSWDKKTQ